ncbi:TIGR03943 family protein [Paenibacillus sp. HB172176]|uniref:TIGR03943 family putative permease subunit n=1 Tax=Paenibacillus sp. HB172176 TaxID=2493690 RepID=UPI00143AE3E3|nr:TIGR03943 family protein [Paenibacillus sp. HB172176]
MRHHILKAAIYTGFTLIIVFLINNGDIKLYIAPRMMMYVKLSAIGVYALAVFQIYAALKKGRQREADECDCGHDHTPSKSGWKNVISYSLFILPLLLVFLMPSGTLGSAMAAKKGISLGGSESIARLENSVARTDTARLKIADSAPVIPAPTLSPTAEGDNQSLTKDDLQNSELDQLFTFDEYTEDYAKYGKELYKLDSIVVPEKQFIETLTTLDLYRDAFMGKGVTLSGFTYREEDMNKDQLVVGRFAMTCCSADALPYGLLIQWPRANEYDEDEWISVTGKLDVTTYMENEIIVIKATKIKRIDPAETPYVYPDFDFGT